MKHRDEPSATPMGRIQIYRISPSHTKGQEYRRVFADVAPIRGKYQEARTLETAAHQAEMYSDRENKRGGQKGKDADRQHGKQLAGAFPPLRICA
jgi:hypothetical protein